MKGEAKHLLLLPLQEAAFLYTVSFLFEASFMLIYSFLNVKRSRKEQAIL